MLQFICELGFNEVVIRFALQGGNWPGFWTAGWNEALFQENWNFIYNVHNLVENTEMCISADREVRRTYDLGLELGGHTEYQAAEYQRRLWGNYTYMFGSADTYGFSVVPVPGRLTTMINLLRQSGPLPPEYAVDIYGDEFARLTTVRDELSAAGELSKPIIIQEDYYNDAQSYQEIVAAKTSLGVRVRTIFQWPWTRGTPMEHAMDRDYTPEFRGYLPVPAGQRGVLDASPALCTLPANGSLCSSIISWSTAPSVNASLYVFSSPFASGPSGQVVAPWIGLTAYPFTMYYGSALLDQVTVHGVTMRGKLATSSSSNTCTLAPGQTMCTLTIYASVPDGWGETISVKANGALFAILPVVGQAVAPWITTQGVTFTLYAGETLLDTLFAHAVN